MRHKETGDRPSRPRMAEIANEAPLLFQYGGHTRGLHVLEIGCGCGIGTRTIFNQFQALTIHAFDEDPAMIQQARQQLAWIPPGRLHLYEANVTAIPEPDASFDAVFDFGLLHHVPHWPLAIAEIARVLKPGGRFYFEEISHQARVRWACQAAVEHPDARGFTAAEFIKALEQAGIQVGDAFTQRFFGDFFIGVGKRQALGRHPNI